MTERVDARDVMDANATTAQEFGAVVVGYFRRTGPNTWDDYEFVRAELGRVDVCPDVPVALERIGTEVRLRRRGKVIRVRWEPSSDELIALEGATPQARRRYFVERYLTAYDDAPGVGAAAVIVSKLR